MSTAVLDFIRKEEPHFKDVPDEDLTLFLGSEKPEFLQDQEFKTEFQKAAGTRALNAAVEGTKGVMGILTNPAAGEASAYARARTKARTDTVDRPDPDAASFLGKTHKGEAATLGELGSELFGVTSEQKEAARTQVERRKALGEDEFQSRYQDITTRYNAAEGLANESLDSLNPDMVAKARTKLAALKRMREIELEGIGLPSLSTEAKLPKLSAEEANTVAKSVGLGERAANLIQTGQNITSGIVEGFAEGLGPGLGLKGPAAAIGKAYVASMAKDVAAKTGEAAGAYAGGDVKAGDTALAEALSTGAMLVGPHVLGRSTKPIADAGAPATAKALEQQLTGKTEVKQPTVTPTVTQPKESDASAIHGDQETPETTGIQRQGGEDLGGQNLQLGPSGTPDAPAPSEAKEVKPTFRPAIRLVPKVPGEPAQIVPGETGDQHVDIIARHGLKAEDIDSRGFVDEKGVWHTREETAAKSGLPTNIEPGRQHSSDLLPREKQIELAKKALGIPADQAISPTPSQPTVSAESSTVLRQRTETKPEFGGMGAAVPGEFGQGSPTSIKNARVDVERQKRGLPAAIQPLRRTFGAVWDQAMAAIDRDPSIPDRLLDDLRDKPRALTDLEDATLLYQQVDLQNEYANATRDLADWYGRGDIDRVAELKIRVADVSDKLLDLYNIGKRVGTETGRGLNARKMLANENFTLADMELQKRAAKGGEPLTDIERTELEALQKKIAETQKAHDEYVAATDERLSKLEADKALAEAKAAKVPTYDQRILNHAENIVRKMERAAEPAAARLRERLMRMSAGVDPTIVSDAAIVGAAKIARLGLDLAKWTDAMVKDFGEKIRPMLTDIWEASNKVLDAGLEKAPVEVKRVVKKQDATERMESSKADIEAKVKKGEQNEISPLVNKLVRAIVERDPKITRDDLVKEVHGILKEFMPDITPREAMDAISGYGQFSVLTKDAISVRVRDLKGQMQQVAKLEDITAKKPPLKTGVERRAPSDEERKLIKQVNEAKRRYGIVVTDPATQLRSALDARKTYYRNQITDLEAQIKSKQKFIKTETPSPTDAELDTLKKRRDDLKTEFDAIFTKPGLTDAHRVAMAERGLDRSIAEIERQIKEGDIFPGGKKVKLTSPELDAKRARIEALKSERQYLRDSINPKPVKTQEEISLQALKTRLQHSTADYLDRLAKGDFAARQRRTTPLDPEAMRLKAANENAKTQFRSGLIADRLKNRTWWEKAMDFGTKWRRFGVLSSPVVIPKLISAGIQRMVFSPLEEFIGSAYGKLPGYGRAAERAPIEGGLNTQAEVKAWSQAFTKGLEDSWKVMKEGRSDLDALYGKEYENYTGEMATGSKILDFPGGLHGMIKTPVKRAAFTRAVEKLADNYGRQGLNLNDPVVQTRIGVEAYKAANRSIFLQDNMFSDRVKRFINSFEENSKTTGKPTFAGKAASTAGRFALPILKVPTNIVAETIQYATGLVSGNVRLAKALRSGIENVKPEEADLIMRELKKGTIGAAFLLIGFFSPTVVGGYYQPGQKRRPDDVKVGSVRIYGHDIPSFLLHNPLLETVQLGATVRRVADSKLRKRDTDTQGIPSGVFAGALGLAEEVPFIREMFDLAKLMNPYTRSGYVDDQLTSVLVPQAVQWVAKQTDKNESGDIIKRDPKTLPEHIESGVPGLRKNVPEKRNQK